MISGQRAYEIPDNTTAGTYNSQSIRNLGYMLLDGTSGKPAGIYDPVNRLSPFQFQGVDVSGMIAARLSLNAYFNTITHVANATWGLTVRFNGGPWRNRFLTPTEVDAINTPGSAGNMAMLLDVPLGDLGCRSEYARTASAERPDGLPAGRRQHRSHAVVEHGDGSDSSDEPSHPLLKASLRCT